jgi:hypothetical protein
MMRKLFIILFVIVLVAGGCTQKLDSEGKDLDCFPVWLITGEASDNYPGLPLFLTNPLNPPTDGVCKIFPWNLP